MKSKKLSSETSLSENGNSCAVVVCLFVTSLVGTSSQHLLDGISLQCMITSSIYPTSSLTFYCPRFPPPKKINFTNNFGQFYTHMSSEMRNGRSPILPCLLYMLAS